MYILIHYREDGDERCPRGCCRDASWSSAFAIHSCDTLPQLVDVIVGEIEDGAKGDHLFLVMDDPKQLAEFSVYDSVRTTNWEDAIVMATPEWDQYHDADAESDRRYALVNSIRKEVIQKVGFTN